MSDQQFYIALFFTVLIALGVGAVVLLTFLIRRQERQQKEAELFLIQTTQKVHRLKREEEDYSPGWLDRKYPSYRGMGISAERIEGMSIKEIGAYAQAHSDSLKFKLKLFKLKEKG